MLTPVQIVPLPALHSSCQPSHPPASPPLLLPACCTASPSFYVVHTIQVVTKISNIDEGNK